MNAELELQAGKMITVTTDDSLMEAVDEDNLWVDYKNIVNVVDCGKKIYVDDGLISLIVREKGVHRLWACASCSLHQILGPAAPGLLTKASRACRLPD